MSSRVNERCLAIHEVGVFMIQLAAWSASLFLCMVLNEFVYPHWIFYPGFLMAALPAVIVTYIEVQKENINFNKVK